MNIDSQRLIIPATRQPLKMILDPEKITTLLWTFSKSLFVKLSLLARIWNLAWCTCGHIRSPSGITKT